MLFHFTNFYEHQFHKIYFLVYSPATWTSTTPAPPPNATVIKTELPNGSNTLFVNSSSTMTGIKLNY